MPNLPRNIPLSAIYEFVENRSTSHGPRDRCLLALRQDLRIKDIAGALVSDLLDHSLEVRPVFTSRHDAQQFEISSATAVEIKRYLINRYELRDFSELQIHTYFAPLFLTNKTTTGYSTNTLAQHLCLMQAAIREHFTPVTPAPVLLTRLLSEIRDIPLKTKENLISRFSAEFA